MKHEMNNTPWREAHGYIVGKNGKCVANVYGRDNHEPHGTIVSAAPELYAATVAGHERIGSWMSAALDDDKVCGDMKKDIRAWMELTQTALEKTGDW